MEDLCPVCRKGEIVGSLKRCTYCYSDFKSGQKAKPVVPVKLEIQKPKPVMEKTVQGSLFDGEFDVFGNWRP